MPSHPGFDPNGPAATDAFFGLESDARASGIVLRAAPYEGTVSYAGGTRSGPSAMRAASLQVDLVDAHFGPVWKAGIAELDAVVPSSGDDQDRIGEDLRDRIRQATRASLEAGRVPGLLGGEHSVTLGAIEACAEHAGELGVIQIDAHMDLRHAYEGHSFSHASVSRNVLERCPRVTRLVQVGIRDWCEEEAAYADAQGDRVAVLSDAEIWDHLDRGGSARGLFRAAIDPLPERVYVTFDIDGLEPALCPSTGTPVPGGLSFNQAACLLQEVVASGRQVVGFDLVEVAPGPDGNEWDANVGARVLYKLCGCAARSNGLMG